jgi:hypothetical protein
MIKIHDERRKKVLRRKQRENFHLFAEKNKTATWKKKKSKFMTNMKIFEQLFSIHYAYCCCELFTYLILFEFPW